MQLGLPAGDLGPRIKTLRSHALRGVFCFSGGAQRGIRYAVSAVRDGLTPHSSQGGVMVDLGFLGQIELNWAFFLAVMSIVLIDLVLAGDNAVVIAMAVKNLPKKKRFWGIALGAGGAVLVRVACTFAVAKLLNIEFIKLVGGAVLIWIGIKLLIEGAEECAEKE